MSTPSTAPAHVFGLIEWDGSYTPTLIAGCCADAVTRTAVRIFAQTAAGGGQLADDDPDFLTEHPVPDPHDPDSDIGGWLDALREATTVPWFTLLGQDDIVRTSDETILLDWTSAIPCTSHPRRQLPASAQPDRDTVSGRPIPVMVNGHPAIAALPIAEGDNRWWVICRRTEPAYTSGPAPLYVVWSAWIDADGIGRGENGNYGPGHGLTFAQAQQVLLERAGYSHRSPATTTVTRDGAIAASIVVEGRRIDLWAQRGGPDFLRVDVCTETGFGCGEATFSDGDLHIGLPDDWPVCDKVRVACLITQIAFYGIATRWDPAGTAGQQ